MPGKRNNWKEILKPGTIAEISVFTGPAEKLKTSSVILSSKEYHSFMEDGFMYECVVLNDLGVVHRCTFHEKELQGFSWFSSRKVEFIR